MDENKKITTLTDDKGNYSTLRIIVLLFTIFSCLILLAIAFYIVKSGFNKNDIDWSGIGLFFVGFASFVTLFLYHKVKQKSVESGDTLNSDMIDKIKSLIKDLK